MVQSVMKTVIARYKSAKSNGHEWSLIDFKLVEYDLVWNRDYSLTKNQFSVNTLEGRLKLNYERKAMKKYFNSTWKFGTAKLVHKYKKWFLHIPMIKEYQTLDFADVNNIVGVDLESTSLQPLMIVRAKQTSTTEILLNISVVNLKLLVSNYKHDKHHLLVRN